MDVAWWTSKVNKCRFWWRIMVVVSFYLSNNFSPTFPYNRDNDTSAPDNTWAWMKIKDISIHTGEHLCMLWSNGLDSVEGQSTLQTVCVYNYKQEIGSTNMNMFPIQPHRISDQHQNIKNWQRQLNLAEP